MKSLEIEIKITVLGKKIKKSDSRRIIKAKTTNGIIEKKKDKIYMVNNNTFKYQYLLSFFKDKLYAGINNENELINYAYNEPFYTLIFSYRNIVFNAKINKFNIYKLNLTKILILDTYIYKLDLSRATYSGIETNFNKII